ncbi:MAG: outer membrane beta-barrel protein [Bacteroidales bacterium]
MKRILSLFIGLLILSSSYAQQDNVLKDTKKKFSIGVDVFTDLWQISGDPGVVTPTARAINQGANVFGMYTKPLGKSNFSFAIGLGLGMHNLYSDSRIQDVNADVIKFEKIPEGVSYSRSKISLTYLDAPFEIRFLTKGDFRISAGFKVGLKINSHDKYKGDSYSYDKDNKLVTGASVVEKRRDINNIEPWRYGATFRIGYKWATLFGYYQLSDTFRGNKGPKIAPISVGISFVSF